MYPKKLRIKCEEVTQFYTRGGVFIFMLAQNVLSFNTKITTCKFRLFYTRKKRWKLFKIMFVWKKSEYIADKIICLLEAGWPIHSNHGPKGLSNVRKVNSQKDSWFIILNILIYSCSRLLWIDQKTTSFLCSMPPFSVLRSIERNTVLHQKNKVTGFV